jgi:hypothetical protein
MQMRNALLGLLCTFAPVAWAAELKIGPYLGHQNLKAHFKGYSQSGDLAIYDPATGQDSVSPNSTLNSNASGTVFENSSVQGLRLTYDLDLVTLRSDLAFSRYVFDSESKQDKVQISLGAQYNVFSIGEIRFYSFAGLGLSRNQSKFSGKDPGYSVKDDPYVLLNYDLAVGSNIPLTQTLSLVVDYKYSDALTKGESKSKTHEDATINSQPYPLNSTSTTKKLSETTQELTLGLLFSL